MYCATPLNLKVCSSVTTAVTASATSCGTYKFINVVVLTTNTTCPVGEMQLTTANEFNLATASPWNLSNTEASLLAGAIIGIWSVGWVVRMIGKAIDGSPDK